MLSVWEDQKGAGWGTKKEMKTMDLKERQIAKGPLHFFVNFMKAFQKVQFGHIFELSTRSAEGALWVLCS